MDDEDGVTANIGDLEPLVKVAGMIGKTVRVGRRPARFSHSDQIRRQTATDKSTADQLRTVALTSGFAIGKRRS